MIQRFLFFFSVCVCERVSSTTLVTNKTTTKYCLICWRHKWNACRFILIRIAYIDRNITAKWLIFIDLTLYYLYTLPQYFHFYFIFIIQVLISIPIDFFTNWTWSIHFSHVFFSSDRQKSIHLLATRAFRQMLNHVSSYLMFKNWKERNKKEKYTPTHFHSHRQQTFFDWFIFFLVYLRTVFFIESWQ